MTEWQRGQLRRLRQLRAELEAKTAELAAIHAQLSHAEDHCHACDAELACRECEPEAFTQT